MPIVYLDANVYNDVERGAIPGEDVAAFQAARARGDIVSRLLMASEYTRLVPDYDALRPPAAQHE